MGRLLRNWSAGLCAALVLIGHAFATPAELPHLTPLLMTNSTSSTTVRGSNAITALPVSLKSAATPARPPEPLGGALGEALARAKRRVDPATGETLERLVRALLPAGIAIARCACAVSKRPMRNLPLSWPRTPICSAKRGSSAAMKKAGA